MTPEEKEKYDAEAKAMREKSQKMFESAVGGMSSIFGGGMFGKK